jgi:hypothetical protein
MEKLNCITIKYIKMDINSLKSTYNNKYGYNSLVSITSSAIRANLAKNEANMQQAANNGYPCWSTDPKHLLTTDDEKYKGVLDFDVKRYDIIEDAFKASISPEFTYEYKDKWFQICWVKNEVNSYYSRSPRSGKYSLLAD